MAVYVNQAVIINKRDVHLVLLSQDRMPIDLYVYVIKDI